ncbi:MAG: hypothetical protein AAGD25_05140 [Cyanobacteria bacterium P01_F01_bin.150]
MNISTINAICADAHDQARFLNNSEMQSVWHGFHKASVRLDAAQQLARCSDSLAQKASQAVYMHFPSYALDTRHSACCYRDITFFLRLISYCLVTDSSAPLDDYALSRLKETYQALELDVDCAVVALEYIKLHHGIEGESADSFEQYLDYLLNALREMRLAATESGTQSLSSEAQQQVASTPQVSASAIEGVQLLQSWLDEDDPEQCETGEFLVHALDKNRSSERKLFPSSMKGVSW